MSSLKCSFKIALNAHGNGNQIFLNTLKDYVREQEHLISGEIAKGRQNINPKMLKNFDSFFS
jgi:hypothetical protein